jgi:origin recognition complex subunit 3
MYQSAGRMINLADWFQAFFQSMQATKPTPKKRQHPGDGDQTMMKKDVVQARFALAVNELGRMGFLKKTRRKADHVLKVVHDLPPTL